ncbi:MAG: peptide chain release factor N(5)-glutamine methyltransferase [Lachnospiraceae bacterium]|nr:peptide chain release factor N(5)-glutamine methyltransferase [Lachnospiraceae bacterium]
MTYSDALKYGDGILSDAGIEEHALDSRLLLEHISGKDRTFILTRGDEESLSAEEEERYEEALKKRSGRYPLQLITGRTVFMGLSFLVSDKVLIPRIDTEFLVEEALKDVCDGADVLDMCTGSGCILLSLMKYKNDIRGTGADISEEALSLARRNAEELGVRDAQFTKSDLFREINGRFDHILCNPPYIKSKEIEGLMEEVKLHEPHNALDGGEDGLLFYREIAAKAGEYLCDGGSLFLEIGYDQGSAVSALLESAGFSHIEVLKDYSGNERVVKCLKSLRKQS